MSTKPTATSRPATSDEGQQTHVGIHENPGVDTSLISVICG